MYVSPTWAFEGASLISRAKTEAMRAAPAKMEEMKRMVDDYGLENEYVCMWWLKRWRVEVVVEVLQQNYM